MHNNGSNFAADEEYFLPGYTVMMILWIAMLIAYIKPVLKSVRKSDDVARLAIYCAFVFLGLAYLYRFLDVLLIYYNGEGIELLRIVYECIKQIVEGVVITILVSISWGWSITHLKHQRYYILMGAVVTFISVVSIIVDSLREKMEEEFHQYDHTKGIILLFLRVLIIITFLIGIFRSLALSVGKIKLFLKRFAKESSIFLFSWPLAFVFAELFLPSHTHREFITLIDETSHLLATAYLCRLFAMPDTFYKKININEEDGETLPDHIN